MAKIHIKNLSKHELSKTWGGVGAEGSWPAPVAYL